MKTTTPRASGLAGSAALVPLLASLVLKSPSPGEGPRTPDTVQYSRPSPRASPNPVPRSPVSKPEKSRGPSVRPSGAPRPSSATPTPVARRKPLRRPYRAVQKPSRVSDLLRVARGELGTSGVPNRYTRWYAERWGRWFLTAPWCAIFVAWAAQEAGVRDRVGTYAYTPSWASWYASRGRWGYKPRRGAIVFFDWSGGKRRSGIDHAGIVEKVHRDGSVTTIEGNSSRRVQRVHRSRNIVGYGYWD